VIGPDDGNGYTMFGVLAGDQSRHSVAVESRRHGSFRASTSQLSFDAPLKWAVSGAGTRKAERLPNRPDRPTRSALWSPSAEYCRNSTHWIHHPQFDLAQSPGKRRRANEDENR